MTSHEQRDEGGNEGVREGGCMSFICLFAYYIVSLSTILLLPRTILHSVQYNGTSFGRLCWTNPHFKFQDSFWMVRWSN